MLKSMTRRYYGYRYKGKIYRHKSDCYKKKGQFDARRIVESLEPKNFPGYMPTPKVR